MPKWRKSSSSVCSNRPQRAQVLEDAGEHADSRPSDKPVVQSVVRPVVGRRVPPLQAIAYDVNDTAQNPAVVGTFDAPSFETCAQCASGALCGDRESMVGHRQGRYRISALV